MQQRADVTGRLNESFSESHYETLAKALADGDRDATTGLLWKLIHQDLLKSSVAPKRSVILGFELRVTSTNPMESRSLIIPQQ